MVIDQAKPRALHGRFPLVLPFGLFSLPRELSLLGLDGLLLEFAHELREPQKRGETAAEDCPLLEALGWLFMGGTPSFVVP